MDAHLLRLEALPGERRWAAAFAHPDGTEQTAVVQIGPAGDVQVAAASLPPDWSTDSDAWLAVTEAVLALERARATSAPSGPVLRDPDGGWDVSLGNVVLADGAPTCIAHGDLVDSGGGLWTCPECGAVARFD